MKLETLIKKLIKVNNEYRKQHDTSPYIFSLDEDGFTLCKKIERPDPCTKRAIKPYMENIKTGLERLL